MIFLFVYYITPKRLNNAVLLLGSILFYSYGNIDKPAFIFLMILSVWVNWRIGRKIEKESRECNRRKWLVWGIVYDFFWLFIFKYLDFVLENVNVLLQNAGIHLQLPMTELVLPLGISFYTFQIVSYLVDVYWKKIPAEGSFVRLGAYICMFPQLIAGPIVSYTEVSKSLRNREIKMMEIEQGAREFTIGLGLKVLLANQLGGLWKEVGAIGYESVSTPLAWLGIIAYSLQIYFDFYGYSLMAIGLGKVMGFRFPENFRHPYVALSMTEFWRRWHITLGRWFRQYVYIPLGGNRQGALKTLRNIAVVWICTGIWHGASWNFVLWGALLCILILLEKAGLKKLLERIPWLGHIYMCLVIPVSWMVFAITDLEQLNIYLYKIFPFLGNGGEVLLQGDYLKYGRIYAISLIIGLIFATEKPMNLYNKNKGKWWMAILLLVVFWASIYCIYIGMDDPFMYFRF